MGCVWVSILVALEKSRLDVLVVGSWDERAAMEVSASWWKGRVVRSIEELVASERILAIRSVSWVEEGIVGVVEMCCVGLLEV